jgi:hypothetical protein
LIKKDFSFSQRGVRFLVDTINSRRKFYSLGKILRSSFFLNSKFNLSSFL